MHLPAQPVRPAMQIEPDAICIEIFISEKSVIDVKKWLPSNDN
jgi:hypothetical protein